MVLASSGPAIIAAAVLFTIVLLVYLLRQEDKEYDREKAADETYDEEDVEADRRAGAT
ncbi:MAG TPA: hypothetical protein VMA83_06125 [Solirubrobacteraceae bacterium]|nr:hypothetical protein [Solirubrobacteraceae bacterium]